MKAILGFVMVFLFLGCEVKIKVSSEPSQPACCDVERDLRQRHALDSWDRPLHCDGRCHWCGVIVSQNGYQTFTHPCHQGQCSFVLPNNTRCACMRPIVPSATVAPVPVAAEAEEKKK